MRLAGYGRNIGAVTKEGPGEVGRQEVAQVIQKRPLARLEQPVEQVAIVAESNARHAYSINGDDK